MQENCKPLNDVMVALLQENIALPAAKAFVLELHEKYLAIMNREISSDANLMSSKDVADMSDGEKILRKLVEPYKGKIVLIDVWGTWCGPCKSALSHSKELYERMAQYDIVFLYLANRSDDESWKNVIKEYEVIGDNVVHYNLLDVNADPRNLDAFENLLKMIQK